MEQILSLHLAVHIENNGHVNLCRLFSEAGTFHDSVDIETALMEDSLVVQGLHVRNEGLVQVHFLFFAATARKRQD
jgi:hypothetical protein